MWFNWHDPNWVGRSHNKEEPETRMNIHQKLSIVLFILTSLSIVYLTTRY